MLTGRRPFPNGETVSDTLANILKGQPDWKFLPADTPPKIRPLLERCLRKDVWYRLRDIGDALVEIEEARSEPNPPAVVQPLLKPPSRRWTYGWASVALVSLATALVLAFRLFFPHASDESAVRFQIFPEEGSTFSGPVELSPDGRKLAFIATSDGKRVIWIRPLEAPSAQRLSTTEGATRLFWSADSNHIAFSADGKLRKVASTGGISQVICNLPKTGGGYDGAWGPNGVILLGSLDNGPLLRVSAAGGQPEPLTQLDASRGELSHGYPSFLPDGDHYVYLASSSNPENDASYVGKLGTMKRERLEGIGSAVKYSSGYVLFTRDQLLMAQPFDEKKAQLSGEAFLADRFISPTAVTAQFSVSATDAIAYRAANRANSRLTWFDRTGKIATPVSSVGEFRNPQVSPDGKLVAFDRGDPADIFVLEIESGLIKRFTSQAAANTAPVWSPDSQSIAFRSSRDSEGNLYSRAFGVIGEDKLLMKTSVGKSPSDWSNDGKYLVYTSESDVWALPLSSPDSKPLQLTQTPFTEANPRLSPDGHWLAYQSNESGAADEVYIQSFTHPELKQLISTAGGSLPRWNPDGKELYYLSPDSMVMAVSIKTNNESLTPALPVPLFRAQLPANAASRNFGVSRDGRFLMNQAGAEQSVPITVILKWTSTRLGQ